MILKKLYNDLHSLHIYIFLYYVVIIYNADITYHDKSQNSMYLNKKYYAKIFTKINIHNPLFDSYIKLISRPESLNSCHLFICFRGLNPIPNPYG